MTVFDHLDDGRTEDDWGAALASATLRPLRLEDATGRRPLAVVVAVAHPDDEALACAGVLLRAAADDVPVTVVMATGGEASHPDSPTHRPSDLLHRRRDELRDALSHLHPAARVRWLGLPDGRVAEHRDSLREALVHLVSSEVLVVSTWERDGHPDHEAVAQEAAAVARSVGARHLQAPIWLWHWGRDDDVPWSEALRLDLEVEEQRAKHAALAAHRSQHEPLSDRAGDEAILSPTMLDHFRRGFETYLEVGGPAPADGAVGVFESLHRRVEDPWDLAGSWYERRKRALTLAALPDHDLGRVLEVGCSVGVLTADLAARARRVTALDVSETALQRARTRLGGDDRVRFLHARVPEQWPEGEYDVVVLSEVGYFLTSDELDEVLRLARESLAPSGSLVLVHWRHPVEGWPLDGGDVHDRAEDLAGLRASTRVEDDDFLLVVLRRAI